ncbi:hypothetical protein C3L33_22901, partial [Rhododendron williamsianum]
MGEVRHVGSSNDDDGFTMRIHTKLLHISVNGTCLTVTRFDTQLGEFVVGLSPETLRKTLLIEGECEDVEGGGVEDGEEAAGVVVDGGGGWRRRRWRGGWAATETSEKFL